MQYDSSLSTPSRAVHATTTQQEEEITGTFGPSIPSSVDLITPASRGESKFASLNYYESLDSDIDVEDGDIDVNTNLDEEDGWTTVVSSKQSRDDIGSMTEEFAVHPMYFAINRIKRLNDDVSDYSSDEEHENLRCYSIQTLWMTCEQYPCSQYSLNIYQSQLKVCKKTTNKVVHVCSDSEVFWADDSPFPLVESALYVMDQITSTIAVGITTYRGYRVYVNFPAPPLVYKKFQKKQKHSRKPRPRLEEHSGEIVLEEEEPSSPPNDTSFLNLLDVFGSKLGEEGLLNPESEEIALSLMKIITHVIAICTASGAINMMACVTSAFLDIVKSPSARRAFSDMIQPTTVLYEEQTLSDTLQTVSNIARNPVMEHLDTIIAMLVSCQFLKEENVTLAGVKMFQTKFSKEISGKDIGLRVLDSFIFLTKLGEEIFATKSFDVLWNLRSDLDSFAKNVQTLKNYLPAIKQGNYKALTGQDESHFENLLVNTTTQGMSVERQYSGANVSVKSYLAVLVRELRLVNDSFRIDQLARGSRVAPLCIKFYGESGVAKTLINRQTMLEILKFNEFPAAPINIANIMDEKYDSTIKSNSTGVIFDDMANTKPEKDDNNPAAKLIRYVNNENNFAIKADLHEKGNVILAPKYVGITTNQRDLTAEYWSCNKGSILRRCQVHVDVALRPEFRNSEGMLDSDKALSLFGPDELQDIYLLSCFYFDVSTGKYKVFEYTDPFGKFPLAKGPMENVSIFVFYEFLYDFSSQHYARQRKVVERIDGVHTMKRCEKCKRNTSCCLCIPITPKFSLRGLPSPALSDTSSPSPYPQPEHILEFSGKLEAEKGRVAERKKKLELMKQRTIDLEKKHEESLGAICGGNPFVNPDDSVGYDPLEFLDADDLTQFKDAIHEEQSLALTSVVTHFATSMCSSFISSMANDFQHRFCLSRVEDRILRSRTFGSAVKFCIGYNSSWFTWYNIVPYSFLETRLGLFLYQFSQRRIYYRTIQMGFCLSMLVVGSLFYFLREHMNIYFAIPLLGIFCGLLFLSNQFAIMRIDGMLQQARINSEEYYASLTEGERTLSKVGSTIFKYAVHGAIVSLILLSLRSAYLSWKQSLITEQGKLNPNEDEFVERNTQHNWWQPLFGSPVKATSSTPSDFANTISKNMKYLEYHHGDETKFFSCNCIYLRTDELMMPKHVFFKPDENGITDITLEPVKTLYIKITKAPVKDSMGNIVAGAKFKFWREIEYDSAYPLSEDWVVVRTTVSSGDVKDLVKGYSDGKSFFGTEKSLPQRKYVQSIFRTKEGHISTVDCTISKFCYMDLARKNRTLKFLSASIPPDTRNWVKGDCGTVLVDRTTKDPVIVGFHLYGSRYKNQEVCTGISAVITQEMIDRYLAFKSSLGEIGFESQSLGPIPEEIAGIPIPLVTVAPNHSPIRFAEGNYDVLGHIHGSVRYKTNLLPTRVKLDVYNAFGDQQLCTPEFQKSRPFDDFLKQAGNPVKMIPNVTLQAAASDYVAPLIRLVHQNGYLRRVIKPMSKVEIINGVPGVRYLDRMVMSSAMGYPYKGKREKFLVRVDNPLYMDCFDWEDPDIWQYFDEYEMRYKHGNCLNHPFVSTLKDEVRNQSKPNPRVFQAAPAYLQMFIRKYFLPLAVLLSNYPLVSECAVGINSFSPEWEDLIRYVESASSRILAGDHSKWDVRLMKSLTKLAYGVLIEVTKHLPLYTDEDRLVMSGIATDLCNPLLLLSCSFIRLDCSNPSGQNMTAYINSISNSLLLRCIAFKLEDKTFDFREFVRASTYGDDLIGSVSPKIRLNFNTFQKGLAEIGMKFTSPTKEELEVYEDFTTIESADFLKRLSVFIPELGHRVGALNKASIFKSFCYFDNTSPVGELNVLTATFEGAAYELFAHGRTEYDRLAPILVTIARKHGVCCSSLEETYDTKVLKWRERYKEDYHKIETGVYYSRPYCVDYSNADRASQISHPNVKLSAQLNASSSITLTGDKGDTKRTNKEYEDYVAAQGAEIPVDSVDIYEVETSSGGLPRLFEQSSEVVLTIDEGESEPVVEEVDHSDPNMDIGVTQDISLSEYLSRPVLISQSVWDIGADLLTSFDPVSLFLGDAVIKRKITNYAYLTGTMHVKVIVDGTSFHFGKAIMAYEPWGDPNRPPTKRQRTVLPYVSIDANSASGGTLSFNLMHNLNGIDLTKMNSSNQRVAYIWLNDINKLEVLGDSSLALNVSVFAWMTDVKFKMTTYVQPLIVEQSGEVTKKPSELPSTDTWQKICSLPVVGKYLKASSIVAKSGMEVASLFGYSKPTVYNEERKAVPTYSGNLPHCNAIDTSIKLSLDSHNDVYVDSHVANNDRCNDMQITEIVKKEILIQQFEWLAESSTTIPLSRVFVTPCVGFDRDEYIELTPMAHVASMFKYWRGSMKYRIEIVGTPFHRGKLRICYDPFEIGSAVAPRVNESYNHILDLSAAREYSFCVGWGTNYPLLRTQDPAITTVFQGGSSGVYSSRFHNGSLCIVPLSPLTIGLTGAGASNAKVYVNVYASMDDDAEFALLSDTLIQNRELYISPVAIPPEPARLEEQSLQLSNVPSADKEQGERELCLNKVPLHMDDGTIMMTHIGERIRSIRQIIKRYSIVDVPTFTRPPSGQLTMFNGQLNTFNIPLYARPTTHLPFNPTNIGSYRLRLMCPFSWMLPAYVGYRGSTRFKYEVIDANFVRHHEVVLSDDPIWSFAAGPVLSNTIAPQQAYYNSLTRAGHFTNAGAFTPAVFNPTVEVECPYYSPERFKVIRTLEFSDPSLDSIYRPNTHTYSSYFYGAGTTTPVPLTVNSFFAAGDDFSMEFYKFPPVVVKQSLPIPT